ncbi:MAG: MarR family transcriptional regulator [Xanthobacteraceae bacterium]|nr:MarR family transcriptional regulator [Xanthobacteraceae bacterium]MBX3547922.1 MarR family transcriptional regulator [Xanthobacteraceae bacterium]MCW5674652.1 MarR family transcriptional regulator [Xanthobacteraceae bacterium]MCW5677001.1 MarR family transcriptional regulator [Xanthobacteraceae bacterium]
MTRKLSVAAPHGAPFSLPRIAKNGGTRGTKAKGSDHSLVETILAQWKRQHPELNFEPMALIAALTQAYHLTSIPIDRMMAKYGLTRGMFDVLAALRRSGKPYELTPKELSASLLLSGAGLTNRLDRLQSLDLISRLPDPTDRRSLRISLTKRGREFVDHILPELLEIQKMAFGSNRKAGKDLTKLLVELSQRLYENLGANRFPSSAD